MKLAMMFPGQGSQSVGMLATLGAVEPVVRETFNEASSVLGYDLWELCQQGPEERLSETERTQPAMLAAGIATWRVWKRRGGAAPATVAGHSLGEYSALVAAGAIEFRSGYRARALPRRGHAARSAHRDRRHGGDPRTRRRGDRIRLRDAAQGSVVQAVNYNSPGQLVIAGEARAVARAIEACKLRGAKRAVLLPVSVPSHSALMKPAAEEMRERLQDLAITLTSHSCALFRCGDLH